MNFQNIIQRKEFSDGNAKKLTGKIKEFAWNDFDS